MTPTSSINVEIRVDPIVATQLPEGWYVSLARAAENLKIDTPELTRRILRGWLDSQAFTFEGRNPIDGPRTLQEAGLHSGYNPRSA